MRRRSRTTWTICALLVLCVTTALSAGSSSGAVSAPELSGPAQVGDVAVPLAALEAAVTQVPEPLRSGDFRTRTDMGSLSEAARALDRRLAGQRRTVSQLVEAARRDRRTLCHDAVVAELAERSGEGVDGFCWNVLDDAEDFWYPQGITGTPDATGSSQGYDGQQLLVASWFHKPQNEPVPEGEVSVPNKGARVSLIDLQAPLPDSYVHVLLVEPSVEGGFARVPVHAGGIAWYGHYLYVADTNNGLRIFDMRRIYSVDRIDARTIGTQPDGAFTAYGYKYVLAQVGRVANVGAALRYSYVSLDRTGSTDSLVVGEYAEDADGDGVPDTPSRVVRFPLDESTGLPWASGDGTSYASEAYDTGLSRIQGVLTRGDKFWFSISNGRLPGLLATWRRGTGTLTTHPWVSGAEDLTYWADPVAADRIWTMSEFPGLRTVVSVPQGAWF